MKRKKKCPFTECLNNIEPCCAIVEITGKVPDKKSARKCSYYRTTEKKTRKPRKKCKKRNH